VTLMVLTLVHKLCVGHGGVGVTVQLGPSVLVILTHLTFEAMVTWDTSTVRVPG
jgi:hypothetical protein